MDSREQIEETAAAWIFKRDVGDWTAADEASLAVWLEQSTAHRIVFLRLNSAWQQAARLKAVGAGIPPGKVPSPEELQHASFFGAKPMEGQLAAASPSRPRRSRVFYIALAASILFATLLAVTVHWFPNGSAYHTEIGGLEAIPMRDGSKVTLNTNSQVRVALTKTERHVTLERGEAFFEVAKDPGRPFVVTAGGQRVIAVGTQFSVRREGDDIRVVVTEGRVRVEPDVSTAARVPLAEVGAGGVARVGSSGVLVQKKQIPEAENDLSWRSGFLVFRETPLSDAVAEFNRYNEDQVILEDPQLAAMHIDGNFRSNNIVAFVRLLENGFHVTVEHDGNRILVRAR